MKLGQRLKELRKQKQYTLRELAERVDVGFTFLNNYAPVVIGSSMDGSVSS